MMGRIAFATKIALLALLEILYLNHVYPFVPKLPLLIKSDTLLPASFALFIALPLLMRFQARGNA